MASPLGLWAIDPGDKHVGIARMQLTPSSQHPVRIIWSNEFDPDGLVALLEGAVAFSGLKGAIQPNQDLDDMDIGAIVCEEFRLFPWMARQQGYSSFATVELIGVTRYLTKKAGIPLYLQGASVKKPAVPLGRVAGVPTAKTSGGRLDFVGRNQHVRDAIAHGVWWALRNKNSPVYSGN